MWNNIVGSEWLRFVQHRRNLSFCDYDLLWLFINSLWVIVEPPLLLYLLKMFRHGVFFGLRPTILPIWFILVVRAQFKFQISAFTFFLLFFLFFFSFNFFIDESRFFCGNSPCRRSENIICFFLDSHVQVRIFARCILWVNTFKAAIWQLLLHNLRIESHSFAMFFDSHSFVATLLFLLLFFLISNFPLFLAALFHW